MQPNVIKDRDPGDETPEDRTALGPYETLVERLYEQALELRRGMFAEQDHIPGDGDGGRLLPLPAGKPGFPNIGKIIDDAKKPQAPGLHPILQKVRDRQKQKTPVCTTVSPGSSPPLTPPLTKSEPATDATPAAPPSQPTQPAPATGKGTKGPQGATVGHRKVEEKKRRLRHNLP